ncbi:MAG: trehalose-phosphatase [Gammaproteobacteria bacterium]|nr:trehalose-phosphatase [Gammaproteobacteria bacterium]
MRSDATTRSLKGWALFLDVDGTLLEIAETPQSVQVPATLKQLLVTLAFRLDGALALVSGRTLNDLDHLFAPLRFCAAGVHGWERREATGRVVRSQLDAHRLDSARQLLRRFAERDDGLLLEDKGHALAVHFRRAPHLSADVRDAVTEASEHLGSAFAMQAGKCVFEIRPSACTKGTSISAFMQQPPFLNRLPIYIGDDLTDEDAFAIVNEVGGISIKVGGEHWTLAQHRLPGVRQVLSWLESIPSPVSVFAKA